MIHRFIFMFLCLVACCPLTVSGQDVALKTNTLYWLATTPNIAAETALSDKVTLEVAGAYNPWTFANNKKLRFWMVQPEVKYWLCQKFEGYFFGIHALGGEYNIKNVDLPFGILPKTEKGRHYEGWYVGGGLTYGYQWLLSEHLNLEGSIGLSCARVITVERISSNNIGVRLNDLCFIIIILLC